MVAYIYNPSIWEGEADKQGIRGQPQLHGKLWISLGYMRPPSQNTEKTGSGEGKEMTGGKVSCPQPWL